MHVNRIRRTGEVGPAESTIGVEGCQVDGCDGEHKAKGFCDLHYRRFQKTGDPLVVRRVAKWAGSLCKVDGCNSVVESKGYCNKHYIRLRLYGDPLGGSAFRIREKNLRCSVDGCVRQYATMGYCGMHYKRFRQHGDPLLVISRDKGICEIEGCGREHLAHGYCSLHYGRWKKHGDPLYRRDRPSHCTVEQCGGKVSAYGLCQKHYMRFRKWGDPHYVERVSDYKGALCAVEECFNPVKSKGWCEKHYDRWHTHGDPKFNMWEIDMDVPTSLYRLFSDEGELLYVGISVRPEKRMYEHSQRKTWWPEVEYQFVTLCNSRRDALELEEVVIKTERPKYNLTHNR